MPKVCIIRPNRTKKRVFTCTDVNRIVRNVRESGRGGCDDAKLASAILHGFGLQDVFCYFINVLAFFNRIKIFLLFYYLFKLLKSLLVLYNIIYRGASRILKAKILGLLEVELGVGWLSKVAIWGVELSAALDVLIGSLLVIITIFEKISGVAPFLQQVCSYAGTFEKTIRVAEIAAVLLDETSIIELQQVEKDIAGVQDTIERIISDVAR